MRFLTLVLISLTIFGCTNSNNNSTRPLDKLFGKLDITDLPKTAEMLDENMYWSIIEKSLQNTNSQDEQEQFLIREISKLTPKEMIGFRLN